MISTSSAYAQSTNRKIGTQFEATADSLVERPHQQPCVVSLIADYQFAHFSDSSQTFQFTPPANCTGPWEKVVLEIDFSENGGVQFDRSASMFVANANIYFGTTPEPLATPTNTWACGARCDRLRSVVGDAAAGNDRSGQLHHGLPSALQYPDWVFTVNADLEFYPVKRGHDHDDDHGRVP